MAVLPEWIPPQLRQLVYAAPDGDEWLHEIKFDGYRMHARLSCSKCGSRQVDMVVTGARR